MANHRNISTKAVGLCLLPSELIQNILFNLVLPEIIHMKLVNKSISYIISDQNFIREYNLRSRSATWLFIYKKRWCRDSILDGFTDQSNRWFKFPMADLLKPLIFSGEDIYFLTACGSIFLFVSNTKQEVIAVNLGSTMVKKIPTSPLGPRGTSSWRRSGMKLVVGSGHFRFLFAELVENRLVLFEYKSKTDKWLSREAKENFMSFPRGSQREIDYIFLNVMNGPSESAVIAVGLHSNTPLPVVVRPRFDGGGNEQSVVGFSWGNVINRLHVYGDGYMMIVRSDNVDGVSARARMLKVIEVWGLSLDGRHWEYISKVPSEIMEHIKKPYGVIMGCVEERNGMIRAVLVSNFEGLWDIIWLSYDIGRSQWTWVPLPDCNMKGSNMAGITFSCGLTL